MREKTSVQSPPGVVRKVAGITSVKALCVDAMKARNAKRQGTRTGEVKNRMRSKDHRKAEWKVTQATRNARTAKDAAMMQAAADIIGGVQDMKTEHAARTQEIVTANGVEKKDVAIVANTLFNDGLEREYQADFAE